MKKLSGRLSYKLLYLSKKRLEDAGVNFYTHQEALDLIKKSYQQQMKPSSIAIASNYNYVYKPKKNHVCQGDEDKVLILPSLHLYSNQTKSRVIRIIHNDYKAKFNEISKLLKPVDKYGSIATLENAQKLMEIGNELMTTDDKKYIKVSDACFVSIPSKKYWCSIQDWIEDKTVDVRLIAMAPLIRDFNFDMDINDLINHCNRLMKRRKNFTIELKKINDAKFLYIPSILKYSSIEAWIDERISKIDNTQLRLSALTHQFGIIKGQSKVMPISEANFDQVCKKADAIMQHMYTHGQTKFDDVLFHTLPLGMSMESWIRKSIDENIVKIDSFKDIQMVGGIKLGSLLQGRDSVIRTALTKKVPAFRAQILHRGELCHNEIILPYTWQNDLNISAKKLVDVTDPNIIDPDCFIDLKHVVIGTKRDPVINACSITFYNRVAFAKTNNYFIGPAEIEHKNSDFDGDSYGLFVFRDPISVLEINLNAMAENNMRIGLQNRTTFTESQILVMHQRQLPLNCKYRDLYNHVRQEETEKWKQNMANMVSLDFLEKQYPHVNFKQFIEPTRIILRKVITYITDMYGSSSAYEFYNYLNHKTVELANGIINDFHDENLKGEYFMEDDLLCEPIIRTCFSGASGSIDSLINLVERIYNKDHTTKLTKYLATPNYEHIFNESYSICKKMSKSSKQVPMMGHVFFKNNVGYDALSYDGNKLVSTGKVVSKDLGFVPKILLFNPSIAGFICRR